ncbi:MAG TPA: deoxyribodipyrimidine photo-lyase [Rhodothermales bacterium]|nr:deoxyribodipyrimidine photo-lyase [Rhodothermales bacterium]
MTILVWFRRDLRVTDNTALNQAIRDGYSIVPFFILNDETILTGGMGAPITHFFFESVKALAGNLSYLGGGLVLRRGDFLTEIERLIQETGARALYFNKDYEPDARARDARIAAFLEAKGIMVQGFKDQVLFEENEILTQAGSPYTVFTPYSRAWLARSIEIPLPTSYPTSFRLPENFSALENVFIPTTAELKLYHSRYDFLVTAGERSAHDALQMFLKEAAGAYQDQRNFPSIKGTSMLSAFLRAGNISIREVYHQAVKAKNSLTPEQAKQVDVFISELIWRDFYFQVLYHFPFVINQDFKTSSREIAWRNAPEELLAWKEGRTGYPIVDAAMRQLLKHGWMHNRLRMITAMFLTKHLLIHWKEGERFFAHHLIDFDLAANNGGWQWSASTGTDAQPYFRIFNPFEQSRQFDPKGDFIRKFIPELANVPLRFLHKPWEMPTEVQIASACLIGKDYPAPIVEHRYARERALAAFGASGK